MRRRRHFVLLSSLSTVVLLLISSLVLIFCVYLTIFQKKVVDTKLSDSSVHGKYYQIDPRTNISESGFVDVYNHVIADEGFIFYETEVRKVLISDFDKTEYICFGKCECEGRRRSSNILISKSMVYLVAALGTLLAYNLAEEYFEENCDHVESCEENSVVSKIDYCQSVSDFEESKRRSSNENIEEKIGTADDTKKSSSIRMFQCKGNCQKYMNLESEYYTSDFLLSIEEKRTEMGLELPCRILELSKEMELDTKGEDEYLFATSSSLPEILRKVERNFVMNDLHSFCTSQSMREFTVFSQFTGQEVTHEANICVGYIQSLKDGDPFFNPSAHCVEM